MQVTVFKNFSETNKPYLITVEKALDRIKEGKSKDLCLDVRAAKTDIQKRELKLKLACVLFSGTFSKRNADNCEQHNGIIVMDFDHVSSVMEFKDKMKKDEYVRAAWISPGGEGVKVMVQTDCNKNNHIDSWRALKKRYPKLDKACKDVSRICFESYDPNLYYNPESKIFKEKEKLENKKNRIKNSVFNESKRTDYTKVQIALNMIHNSYDGNKHHTLLKASKLMGGYVAGGSVEEDEAIRLLEHAICKKDILDYRGAEKTILDGIQYGKNEPIDVKEIEQEAIKDNGLGKLYYTGHDLKDKMLEIYHHGNQKGYETGYSNLDKHYSVLKGATTYVYGAPHNGKTQLWYQILVNLSLRDGLRHLVFSPENGHAAQVAIDILEIIAGKTATGKYKMTEEEFKTAHEIYDQHFLIVDPEGKDLKMDDFFNQVIIAESEYETTIDTVTIDPFNELKNEIKNESRDMWLERVLGEVRKFARGHNKHVCIITHVRDQAVLTQKTPEIRYYPMPEPREIAYGQAWYRKGLAMIAVWRPKFGLKDENGIPYLENETVVAIQKVKPKGIGEGMGSVRLFYDFKSKRYFEHNKKEQKTYEEEQKYNTNSEDTYNEFDDEAGF